jgi:PAS domain S-box-containing protein
MTPPQADHQRAAQSELARVVTPAQSTQELSQVRPNSPHGWAVYLCQVALLAVVYLGAAKLGLTMAFLAEQVTPVWPPTGIALAALLYFGYRVWPGVALGALMANVFVSAPLGAAASISLGNTLEALLAVWLLRNFVKFDAGLQRLRDVLGLVLVAAGLSTMVSATIGVTSLCLGGVTPWTNYAALWSVWWLGDAMGDLVVAPLLLTWAGWRGFAWPPRRVAEAGALLLGLSVACLAVFAGPRSTPSLCYVIFPFMIWAALRFGLLPASLATALASGIAICGTVQGFGPYQSASVHENLILLQIYLGVVASTTLVLAAATTAHAQAEESLQQSYGLLRGVTEGTTDAVFVKDTQGRYLMINTAGADFLDKPVTNVIGQDDRTLFSPETARAIMERDRQIMATGDVRTFEEVGTVGDVTRMYLSTKGPYRDARGAIVGLIGISRDITARMRAERRLRAEHAVTRALAESSSLKEAAPRVLCAIGETLGCDLGVFWRVGQAPEFLRGVAVWRPSCLRMTAFEEHLAEIAFARGEGLPGKVWASGQPAWVPDATFPRSVAAPRSGPCGALAFPVRGSSGVLAVLEFFSPELQQPEEGALAMIASIGMQVGQFFERRQAEIELHARARELGLAREIQQGQLPKAPPALDRFELAGMCQPAQETGGDYFDFIPMSDGCHGVCLGDASGHGIGPALLIAETRAYLRALALTHSDPGAILGLLNRRLAEDMRTDHFVTLLFARLCTSSRSLFYSNAGHWPAYVLGAEGQVKLVLHGMGPPLGVDPTGDFGNGPGIALEPGDLVLMVSDGIVEASSPTGSLFGVDRALALVRSRRHEPANAIIAALFQEVRAWSQSAQLDDMTAIVIKVRE